MSNYRLIGKEKIQITAILNKKGRKSKQIMQQTNKPVANEV